MMINHLSIYNIIEKYMEVLNMENENPNILVECLGDSYIFESMPYSSDIKELDYNTAYIKGDLFYLYRGPLKKKSILPGIYDDMDTGKHVFIEPTGDALDEYDVRTHIAEISVEDMLKVLKKKPESKIVEMAVSNSFLPEITRNDDPLKRLIKTAIIVKKVNIDSCKGRFADRNALFNFKSVMKSDATLSMLLFMRALDALNLDMQITLVERDKDFSIGVSLDDPEAKASLEMVLNKFGIKPKEIGPDTGHISVSNADKYELQGEV